MIWRKWFQREPVFNEDTERRIDNLIHDPAARAWFKSRLDDRPEIEEFNRVNSRLMLSAIIALLLFVASILIIIFYPLA